MQNSSFFDQRKPEIDPVSYLSNLLELKQIASPAERGKIQKELDSALENWVARNANNPAAVKALEKAGEPLEFALAYLQEKTRDRKTTPEEHHKYSAAYQQASAFIASHAAPGHHHHEAPEHHAHHEEHHGHEHPHDQAEKPAEKSVTGPAEIRLMQQDLMIIAERSEPHEAISALLLLQLLGTPPLPVLVAGAVLLLKKYTTAATKEEKSLCLNGVVAVLDKNQMRYVRDPLDRRMMQEDDPDLVMQMASMQNLYDDIPVEDQAPSHQTAKNEFRENSAMADNPLKALSAGSTHRLPQGQVPPKPNAPKPSASWFTGKTTKSSADTSDD
jgi:hypothetical protein